MLSPSQQLTPGQQRYATVGALLGWFALALQLYLILWGRWADQASVVGGLVRFFSFFTVVTNTLVAVALSCALTERRSAGHRFFRSPVVCAGITTSILLVGIAYNLLLRPLWSPQGWQLLADELLHDVMPLLFFGYWWLFVPKGVLGLRHLLAWMLYPVLYFLWLLLRGHVFGDYLYPFLDIGTLGVQGALINAFGVLAGFVGIGLVVILIDRLRGSKT
ncbi:MULTISPECIES: Pr6Pr family membrane protein [unclassified Pseudomonas]|uniref:Pr6Pr family membrane protein n=1 Tax=unclassified Pseudomonas TaxID=196821 RepID=UPI0025FF88F7|nr:MULTISPECIES: Pr6Pr family membrane protein [unclassified Pseudomonas]